MAYASWSVIFGETPSASKWNILGTNDAFFSTLGTLGYVQVTANQTGFGAIADIASLTSTVTVGAGRRIKVSGHVVVTQQSGAGTPLLSIFEGSTQLGACQISIPTAGFIATFDPFVILTPTTGSHTYKLRLQTTANTCDVNASATAPAYILVEDISV